MKHNMTDHNPIALNIARLRGATHYRGDETATAYSAFIDGKFRIFAMWVNRETRIYDGFSSVFQGVDEWELLP